MEVVMLPQLRPRSAGGGKQREPEHQARGEHSRRSVRATVSRGEWKLVQRNDGRCSTAAIDSDRHFPWFVAKKLRQRLFSGHRGCFGWRVPVQLTRRRRPRSGYLVPIPTLCTVWKSLPSVLMLGAMMISVS